MDHQSALTATSSRLQADSARKRLDEIELKAHAERDEQELVDLKALAAVAVDETQQRLKANRDEKKAAHDAKIELCKKRLDLEQRLIHQQLEQQELTCSQAAQTLREAADVLLKTANELRISAPAALPEDPQPRYVSFMALGVGALTLLLSLCLGVLLRLAALPAPK